MVPDQTVCLRAAAKVNLTLHVLGRRPDGYHDIVSWVAPINLFDTLTVRTSSAGLSCRCDMPDLPLDDGNLVVRAVRLAAETAGRTADVEIDLHKRIPISAGLGGGSSDAAATLRALARLWRLDWPMARLQDLAARLGSDVPLFLAGGQCIVRGRGEIVEPVEQPWRGYCVLLIPPFGVSTQRAYAAFSPSVARSTQEKPTELAALPAARLRPRLFNDLEPAAFRVEPRLAALHAAVDGLEGVPVRVTGSGSALFAIFDVRDEAGRWEQAARFRVPADVRFETVSVWPDDSLAS